MGAAGGNEHRRLGGVLYCAAANMQSCIAVAEDDGDDDDKDGATLQMASRARPGREGFWGIWMCLEGREFFFVGVIKPYGPFNLEDSNGTPKINKMRSNKMPIGEIAL